MFSLWAFDSFFSHLGGANHGDQRRFGWFPLWAPSRRRSGDFRSLIGVLAAHFGISAAQLGILSVFHLFYLFRSWGPGDGPLFRYLGDVRRGVVLGCALDFPRPLGGLRSLGEGWWRSLGSVSAGEALGT